MKFLSIPLAIGVAVAILPSISLADDEGLYGAALPDDAVFIRWLDDDAAQETPVFGYTFTADQIDGNAYVAISNAALNGAEAGDYYSVLSGADGDLVVIQEPQRNTKSKVHVMLLNASDDPVQLNLAGTDKTVISATDNGQVNTRAVNPVSAKLAVITADTAALMAEVDVTLRRGQNITIAVLDNQVQLIENRFGAVVETE